VADILNTSAMQAVSLAFIPAFVISLGLSIPVIRMQVAADKSEQVINTIRKSETEGDKVRTKINEEGI
ncbi:MAG: hypothetical protein NTW48_00660, partial [Chloroflexi bacterium]|nr:hypothetical protein [Chloroflexota bacterium]